MCEIINEQWQDIKGYEGLYQVSNLGQVKALTKQICVLMQGRNVCQTYPEKILRLYEQHGYLHVHLRKNGTRIKLKMHRLVTSVFLENPEEKEQVNHRDKDRTHNCILNLEWCTHEENTYHRDNYVPNNEPF